MSAPWHRSLGSVAAYAIALSLLEASVVIYLRALYYPDGFRFPLAPMDHYLGMAEVLREIGTMVLLLVPGLLISRDLLDRFAWFCVLFGAWDLLYYAWLKLLIGWPSSLIEWDILFLIPVPWVGPVLAPSIVSVGLIAFGLLLIHVRARVPQFKIARWQWVLLFTSRRRSSSASCSITSPTWTAPATSPPHGRSTPPEGPRSRVPWGMFQPTSPGCCSRPGVCWEPRRSRCWRDEPLPDGLPFPPQCRC
jgi:hypothetical protein